MSRYWRGIGLPWGTTIPSVIDPKDDFEVIRSSIIWICLTSFGERCFTGDTKVSLVNGTEVPIKDLVGKGEFWVYAYDKEDQKIVPAKATARKTRDSAELVQVALDNGEVVKCTPDHPWMLRDGSYREAKDLKPGDSLMPLYRKVTCVTKLTESVQPVYDLAVDQYHNFALSAGVFVHNCMEPTFGSALQSLVFEPNDIQAVTQMKNAVRDAITKWDDRVEFVDFTVEPNGNELRCKVLYRFATDEIHNDILVSEFTLTQDMMTQR